MAVQRRWRYILARRAFRASIDERRRQLRFFSWPIALFLFLDVLADYVFNHFLPWRAPPAPLHAHPTPAFPHASLRLAL